MYLLYNKNFNYSYYELKNVKFNYFDDITNYKLIIWGPLCHLQTFLQDCQLLARMH